MHLVKDETSDPVASTTTNVQLENVSDEISNEIHGNNEAVIEGTTDTLIWNTNYVISEDGDTMSQELIPVWVKKE